MRVQASKFKDYLSVRGSGNFGTIEYGEKDSIVLRIASIKTTEISGTVRMYFDAMGNEVITGRRFEPVISNSLRPGIVYKIQTTVKVADLPEGIELHVDLTEDASGVMSLVNSRPLLLEDGTICVLILSFRRLSLSEYVAPFRLFFEAPMYQTAQIKKAKKTKKKLEDSEEETISERDVKTERI